MKNMKKVGLGLILGLFFSCANAAIVSIDYTFDDRSIEFNGVTQNTGGIVMSIVVDTDTPNLGVGFGSFQNFYDVDVFFTSTGLGLNHERVTSNTYLYFGGSVFGFSDTSTGSFGTIFTAIGTTSNLSFGTAYDLSTLIVPQGPVAGFINELRTANDIVFENGDRITGGGNATISSSTTVALALSPTPVPTLSEWSLILLIFLLGMVGFIAYRKVWWPN